MSAGKIPRGALQTTAATVATGCRFSASPSRPRAFTDVPQNCLSLINLESVRNAEARLGASLDSLRFRANLYICGAAPWSEFDWVGRDIQVGDMTLAIPSRIPRCAATAVNPQTGERDVNV